MNVGELIDELTKYPADKLIKVNASDYSLNISEIDGEDPECIWIWCE